MQRVTAFLKKLLGQFSLRDLLVLCLAIANGLLSIRQFRPSNEWDFSFNRETAATTEFFVGAFLVIWFWSLWKARLSASAGLPTPALVVATVQSLGCFWARSTFGTNAFFESEEAMKAINFAPTTGMWEFGIWFPVIITALPAPRLYRPRHWWLGWLIPIVIYTFAICWMVHATYEFTQIVALVEIAVRGIMAAQPYRRGADIIYVYDNKEALDQRLFSSAGQALFGCLVSMGVLWSLLRVIRRWPIAGWCAAFIVGAAGISGTCFLAKESLAIFAEAAPFQYDELPGLGRIHLCGALFLFTSCFFVVLRRMLIPVNGLEETQIEPDQKTGYRKFFPAVFGLVVIVWKLVEYLAYFGMYAWWPSFAISVLVQSVQGLVLIAALASLAMNIYHLRFNNASADVAVPPRYISFQAAVFALILATQVLLFVVSGMLFGFALYVIRDSPLEWLVGHGGR
jgi:hypothetical protein